MNTKGWSIVFCVLAKTLFQFGFVDANCPNGWCRHADMCYLTVGINVSWIDAKDYCVMLGGVVPLVKSAAIQTAIEGVLAKTETFIFPGKFWLDAADLQNPGEWVWMADKSSFSYTNWFPGYPSLVNDTDRCLGITHADGYHWKPAPCEEHRNLLCQARG